MSLTGTRTFAGFGFGAIQSGLFLYEAYNSAQFRRLVIAEVMPEVVDAVRRKDGYYCVNIAHWDRVESARVGPIEIHNPPEEQSNLSIDALRLQKQFPYSSYFFRHWPR